MHYPVVRLYPLARRLGQMDADDLRGIQKMDPEDLVTLGRVISSGRIIFQNPVLGTLRDVIGILGKLGIDFGKEFTEARDRTQELEMSLGNLKPHLEAGKDIIALGEIARVLVEKRPDIQVVYRKANGEIQVVASRGSSGSLESISLDPPDVSLGGALRYVQENQGVDDKVKKAASLGNPGWLLLILAIVIVLALAAIAIVWILSAKKEKWEKSLIEKIAENEAEAKALKEKQGKTTDPAEIQRLQKEIDRLEAEKKGMAEALKKSQDAGSVIEQVIRALGIGPVVKWIVAGAGIILLGGLLLWVLDRKPEPKKPAHAYTGREA